MDLPKYDPTFDPLEQFDRLKIPVITHSLRETNALWVPERYENGMVLVNRGLEPYLLRPTLTHEYAHATNGDCGGHHPSNEARANLHSALRLVDPHAWIELTSIHSDYDYICIELGVTRRQFRAYADHRRREHADQVRLEKIGNVTYLAPKMGAGQWQARIEVA